MNTLQRAIAAISLGLLSTGMLCAAPPVPLSVLPARVELSDKAPSAALTVRNDGLDAIVVQLQATSRPKDAVLFGHEATADAQPDSDTPDRLVPAYEPTADVQATPPTFTLLPGATQTVDVALRASAMRRDLSYQLVWRAVVASVNPYR